MASRVMVSGISTVGGQAYPISNGCVTIGGEKIALAQVHTSVAKNPDNEIAGNDLFDSEEPASSGSSKSRGMRPGR